MTSPAADTELRSSVDAALAATGASGLWAWAQVAADARHEIWRIRSGDDSLIVKVYRPEVDRYYHHRWRREERALDLLERAAPGLAPKPRAAVLAPGAFAAVAMEDLDSQSLAGRLETASTAERAAWLERAISALANFRQAASLRQGMFRALAFQSDLDRITRGTVERRLSIAAARLDDPALTAEPGTAPRRLAPDLPWRDIDIGLVRPLVHARRRVVHNGFSPLNLLLRSDDRLAVIDWETLAVAAPAVDAADLLTFPGFELTAGAIEAQAGSVAPDGSAHETQRQFWAAAAERSLTYAATAAVREQRATASPTEGTRTDYLGRRQWYLRVFSDALDRLDLDAGGRRRIRESFASLDA